MGIYSAVREGKLAIIWERDPHVCVWCGIRLRKSAKNGSPRFRRHSMVATLDHLMPRALGGPDVTENLVLACSECNRARRTVLPANWAHRCQSHGKDPQFAVLSSAFRLAEERLLGIEEFDGFLGFVSKQRRLFRDAS